jgi:DNA-binding NarL/FixJ family response regulator
MCRYCGSAISPDFGFNRYGRTVKLKAGEDALPEAVKYCSKDCADAVHGFDSLPQVRGGATWKQDDFVDRTHSKFGRQEDDPSLTANVPGFPQSEAPASDTSDRNATVSEILLNAVDVDPRLPGILAMIMQGRNQRDIALKMKLSEGTISGLLKRLRATQTTTPQADTDDDTDEH